MYENQHKEKYKNYKSEYSASSYFKVILKINKKKLYYLYIVLYTLWPNFFFYLFIF